MAPPARLHFPSRAVAIACGGRHACVILDDGSLWAVGVGAHGQLGQGDRSDRPLPVRVGSLRDVRGVACGEDHTCAIAAPNGAASAWRAAVEQASTRPTRWRGCGRAG